MANRTPLSLIHVRNLIPLLNLFKVFQRATVYPGESLSVAFLLELFGHFKELGMLLLEALPFADLLVETEVTSRSRSPLVVLW